MFLLNQEHSHSILVDFLNDTQNFITYSGDRPMDGSSSTHQLRLGHQSPAHGQHLLLTAGKRTGHLVLTLLPDAGKRS